MGNLVPLTMYEVTVTAWNENGSSLPSNAVRTLTLTPGQAKPFTTAKPPKLPDVRACCVEQNITHAKLVALQYNHHACIISDLYSIHAQYSRLSPLLTQ